VRGKPGPFMLVQGTAALRDDPDDETLSPGETGFTSVPCAPVREHKIAEKRSLSRMKGYTGEACGECGNFTLVRNGTCLKCDTCGATTGCS
jgi:ribonucleoside-diphosphate reductase alpha chain